MTVLALSFIQSVVPAVVAPEIVTPKAQAVTAAIDPTLYASGTSIVIPTGVFEVTIEAVGGAGGKGGDDSNVGKNGTVAGRTILTLAVTPGDVLGLFPGNPGGAGSGCVTSTGGGTGGASSIAPTPLTINGTYFSSMNFGIAVSELPITITP